MSANSRTSDRPYRYGDFPRLFWDAQPDAPIDVRNPVTLARLLTRADARTVGTLVPLEILKEKLEELPVPEHTKVFWRRVLDYLPTAAGPVRTAG